MSTYFNTSEVGKKMKKDPHTIRDWIRFGCKVSDKKVKLKASKFGKAWRVKDEDLELFEYRVRSLSERPDLDLGEGEG